MNSSTSDFVMATNKEMDTIHSNVEGEIDSVVSVEDEITFSHEDNDEETLQKHVIDYGALDVTEEIKDLFQYIDAYEPIDIELETPLKCFIPPYIPAIGEVDPMIKIPRPDGIDDGIGITRLDEVIAAEQSNAAVIELQLRNWSKTRQGKRLQCDAVRGIKDAASCSKEIDEWIQSVEEIHDNETHVPTVDSCNSFMKELLKPWPEEMRKEIKNNNLQVPSPDIDLSLCEYARVLCSLFGIPVEEGRLLNRRVEVKLTNMGRTTTTETSETTESNR